jgi:predicted membrane channel-forming protein YqfA (hemolysin III family)
MTSAQHKPSWRKPVGVFLIMLLIAVWAALVASLFEWIPRLAWPLQALFFIAAGIIWILPLRPLLIWIETGRWRA